MAEETLGSVYSLLCALSWGTAVVLFKRSGDGMDPVALNTFKNLVGLGLMLFTCLALGTEFGAMPAADAWLLMASGAVGIGVADTLLFAGLNILGAGRQAIVDCLYSPAVVLFAYLVLGEVLTPVDGIGAGVILAAVLLVVLRRGATNPRGERILVGVLYSAVSVLLMAIAIVVIKPLLERYDVLLATTVRMFGGVGALFAGALLHRRMRMGVLAALKPQRTWRFALPGAVIGTYAALLFWIAGFKYAPAGVSAILNQTSTLFIVVLAALFLRERLNTRLVVAVVMAFAGSVIVIL